MHVTQLTYSENQYLERQRLRVNMIHINKEYFAIGGNKML